MALGCCGYRLKCREQLCSIRSGVFLLAVLVILLIRFGVYPWTLLDVIKQRWPLLVRTGLTSQRRDGF
jgi:NADH:ubiquinone oxidoreductase subunit 4 (subunit M)